MISGRLIPGGNQFAFSVFLFSFRGGGRGAFAVRVITRSIIKPLSLNRVWTPLMEDRVFSLDDTSLAPIWIWNAPRSPIVNTDSECNSEWYRDASPWLLTLRGVRFLFAQRLGENSSSVAFRERYSITRSDASGGYVASSINDKQFRLERRTGNEVIKTSSIY